MQESLPHVAVVILSWNGKQYLSDYLPVVLKTRYLNFLLYVADNASTDGSVEWLRKTHPQVKVVETGYNAGFAEGYNIALQKIEADYYVLLNQDVAVEPNWLDALVETAESDKNIGALQPKMRAYRDPEYFEYAGAAGGFIDRWGYPFCRGRIFDALEKDKGQYNDSVEIAWASGAALFIRSELYHQLGGLDKDFFAHMEEIDLCWRLKNAGYKIKAVPKSIVYHLGGGSLNYGNPRKTELNFRNSLRMLLKNAPSKHVNRMLFMRFLLDFISVLKFISSGHFGDAKAILKAQWAFYKELNKWKRKRKAVWKIVQKVKIGAPNRKGFYKRSIVQQFFLHGKKRFSQLDPKDFY